MFAVIVGGGKVGSYVARVLREENYDVTIIEQDPAACDRVRKETDASVRCGDGCEPNVLEDARIKEADVAIAVTGHDEDNLVVCLLAKREFNVPMVIGRINNPRNEWLFTKKWGVDVAVSSPHIIARLLQEEITLGDVVSLLKLHKGDVALLEYTLPESSKLQDAEIKDIGFPSGCIIASIIRGKEIIVPRGDTRLQAKDELLIVTSSESQDQLTGILAGTK